jgi:hypothetical protein
MSLGEEFDGPRRSWQPVDLGPVLDGSWQPPKPTVGRRTDEQGLFYASKCHTVISETEGGKTWLALCVSLDEIRAGNHVLYLDFEDDEGTVVGRLLTLGGDRDEIAQRFHYLRPEEPLGGNGINHDDLRDIVVTYRPTFDVVDGTTEAMTMHGLNPLDNADAATFGRMLPRWLAAGGAAVANLDHVTKSQEGRGRYAIGAVHKLNALDGASYTLENRQQFGVGLTGRSTVKIAKDRPGQLRANGLPGISGLHWYGDLVLESHDKDSAEVSIEPPRPRDEGFKPTRLMVKVSELLEAKGPLAQRVICDLVTGKTDNIRRALSHLIADGYVSSKTPHVSLKPYRIEAAE